MHSLPPGEAPSSPRHHRRGVHHGARHHKGDETAVAGGNGTTDVDGPPQFLRALPHGKADYHGGRESAVDRSADVSFCPTLLMQLRVLNSIRFSEMMAGTAPQQQLNLHMALNKMFGPASNVPVATCAADRTYNSETPNHISP